MSRATLGTRGRTLQLGTKHSALDGSSSGVARHYRCRYRVSLAYSSQRKRGSPKCSTVADAGWWDPWPKARHWPITTASPTLQSRQGGALFFFQPAKKSCSAKARTRLNRAVFFFLPACQTFFPSSSSSSINDTRLNRLCSCRLLLLKSS